MMKTKWFHQARYVAAATLALALAPAWSVSAATPDSWITTKAKLALLTSEGVGATAIDVDTVDGRVTLHGKVASETAKTKAASVVKDVEGVRELRNLLQVVPERQAKQAEASDDEIRRRVDALFQDDKRLASSGITVQSVNNGVVLLGGETTSMETHLRAVTAAAGVPGVRRVATEVKGGGTIADAEAGQSATGRAASAARSVEDTASDAWITSATKLRLLADAQTPALDINVDTRNGQVVLFGIVPSAQAKQAAEANARKVSGVKGVTNDLQVVPSKQRKAIVAKDDDLERAVEKNLGRRDVGDDVNVEVKGGVARLTGTVPDEDARITAATAARATPGVKAVLWEDLRVSKAPRK